MRVTLTEDFIQSGGLRCPDGRKAIEFVSDDPKVRGMLAECARGTPGRAIYRFRFKHPGTGKTTYIRIGSTTEISLPDAMAKAKEFRRRLDAGLEPVVEEKPQPTMPTFREFFQETYIPLVRHRKRSWKRDKDIFRLRLADIADTPLDQITRLQLMKLHIKLKESGLAAATSNHGLKVARQTLSLGVSLDVISKNVASGIPLFPEEDLSDKSLTTEEMGRLIKVLRTDRNRNVCRILLMAAFSGARIGEVLSCRHSDLDLPNKIWRIPAASAKTKRPRLVPLNDSAIEVLSEIEKTGQSDFVFVNARTGQRYTTVSKVWERLRTDAGLPNARIHSLRHAWASRLASNQENAFTISRLMGHSSVKMSEKYVTFSQATLLDASNRAAKSINENLEEIP